MIQGESTAKAAARERESGETAARRRAAVALIARHEHQLKRTARRYSLDAEDVEDAFQRAMEIVLTKAPSTDPRELIRWTQTVIKHEALSIRRNRERLLGAASPRRPDAPHDPVALLPARGEGPDEQAERREDMARTREALRALKPAELRALTLLAEGYSYAEIAEIAGFSATKVNRCVAEGRERFRSILFSSESGERCRELRPALSAFCDGEAGAAEAALVREHLRACASCRATMRTYRTTPRLAVALVPALPLGRSLLARGRELLASFATHAGAAKQAAVCAGLAGTVAAGVATGALPAPAGVGGERAVAPAIERTAGLAARDGNSAIRPGPRRGRVDGEARGHHRQSRRGARPQGVTQVPPAAGYEAPPAETAVPSAPPEAPAPAPAPQAEATSGSAAGEFGP